MERGQDVLGEVLGSGGDQCSDATAPPRSAPCCEGALERDHARAVGEVQSEQDRVDPALRQSR